MSTGDPQIIGYILAGGQSSRFDHQIKGLVPLEGKPLIQHAIDRLKSQVDELIINSHFTEYETLGLPIVPDHNEFLGPLFGVYHCMQHQRTHYPEADWVAIAPCDAPFVPTDMIELLISSNSKHSSNKDCHENTYLAQCLSYESHIQPTFSIWHRDVFDLLEAAIKEQQWGGLKIFLRSLSTSDGAIDVTNEPVNIIEYPKQDINPFFNVNSQQGLDEAVELLKSFEKS